MPRQQTPWDDGACSAGGKAAMWPSASPQGCEQSLLPAGPDLQGWGEGCGRGPPGRYPRQRLALPPTLTSCLLPFETWQEALPQPITESSPRLASPKTSAFLFLPTKETREESHGASTLLG